MTLATFYIIAGYVLGSLSVIFYAAIYIDEILRYHKLGVLNLDAIKKQAKDLRARELKNQKSLEALINYDRLLIHSIEESNESHH